MSIALSISPAAVLPHYEHRHFLTLKRGDVFLGGYHDPDQLSDRATLYLMTMDMEAAAARKQFGMDYIVAVSLRSGTMVTYREAKEKWAQKGTYLCDIAIDGRVRRVY